MVGLNYTTFAFECNRNTISLVSKEIQTDSLSGKKIEGNRNHNATKMRFMDIHTANCRLPNETEQLARHLPQVFFAARDR